MSLSRKIKFGFILGILSMVPVFAQTGTVQIPVSQVDSFVKERMNVFVQDNSWVLLESITQKNDIQDIKKEILEQGQKKVDWWLAFLGVIITLATVLFVYDAIAIKSSLKEVKEEAKLKIKELEDFAADEKQKLTEIYKQEKDELNTKTKELEQAMEFTIEFARAMAFFGWRRHNDARNLFSVLSKRKDVTISQRVLCFRHIWLSYWEEKKYDDALNYMNQAIDLDPDNIMLIVNKAQIFRLAKQYDDALGVIDEWLRLDPENEKLLTLKKKINKEQTSP